MHLNLNRKLAIAALAGFAFTGAAMAQSATPASPSKTPNDSTAAQPNRPLPAGQQAPAPGEPSKTTTTPSHSGTMSNDKDKRMDHNKGMDGKTIPAPNSSAPRDVNPNSPGTNYPNTGGK
ncbi:hypothetical protein [Bordetella genomosp. 5]|uniref:hypothetical protein n=1 Tax=Bordetella genomosp. 5 TaxID=1395608 RepID=UPI001BB005D6|nr:hypothetical protein [Bordetella genomosp. 5]